jgi:hypothetical protein
METHTDEQEPEVSNFLHAEHERISREIGYLTMNRLLLDGQLRSAIARRDYDKATETRAVLLDLEDQLISLEEELSHTENRVDEWNHLQRQLVRLEDSLDRHDSQIAAIERDLDFAHESRLVTLTHLFSVKDRIARITGIPTDKGDGQPDEDSDDEPVGAETTTI